MFIEDAVYARSRFPDSLAGGLLLGFGLAEAIWIGEVHLPTYPRGILMRLNELKILIIQSHLIRGPIPPVLNNIRALNRGANSLDVLLY